MLMTFHFPCL